MTEIFFGDEDEPNARFVYLIDCNHIVEASGMDKWMESRYSNEDGNQNTIQMPECPKCKTPIRQNYRYAKYIKAQQSLIESVKSKMLGEIEEINLSKKKLEREILKSGDSEQNLPSRIITCLKKDISLNECLMLENKWSLLKKMKEIEEKAKNQKMDEFASRFMKFEMQKLNLFLNNQKRFINSNQEINDINLEVRRIEKCVDFFKLKHEASKIELDLSKASQVGEEMRLLEEHLVQKVLRFDQIEEKCEQAFEVLKEMLNVKLTEAERIMIVNAIGLRKGHWFKCRNGHIYCIGECGGAMEKAKCPECKDTIGGANHALTHGNQLATEMDGAAESAWPGMVNNF